MTGDVTKAETMRKAQGERVLVTKTLSDGSHKQFPMTVVQVVDMDRRELRLTNRDAKDRKPDWPLGQGLFDAIHPASTVVDACKWELRVK